MQELLTSGRASPPIFFTAPRGLGKTVLLRHLQDEAAEAGFIVVWVTANPAESLIASLVAGARSAIRQTLPEIATDLLSRLESVTVRAGLPGVLQLEASTGAREPHEVSFAVEMAGVAKALRDHGAAGLMLFVDELQGAPDLDLAALVPALQEWTAARERLPLMFVGSGPIQLSRVLAARGGGFAERFQYVPLERLSAIDSMTAFTLGMPEGFFWMPGALEAVVAAAEGHPYLIQLIGHHAWEASDSSTIAKPFFSVADIDLGVERARQEIRRAFDGRWADTTDEERRALYAVASAEQGRLTRSQIVDISGMTTREADLAVDVLYANGWLDVDGLDHVRIGLPGVREVVLRRQ